VEDMAVESSSVFFATRSRSHHATHRQLPAGTSSTCTLRDTSRRVSIFLFEFSSQACGSHTATARDFPNRSNFDFDPDLSTWIRGDFDATDTGPFRIVINLDRIASTQLTSLRACDGMGVAQMDLSSNSKLRPYPLLVRATANNGTTFGNKAGEKTTFDLSLVQSSSL
jgi:hypothetical protein